MRTVDDYLDLPYHIGLVRDFSQDLGPGWVATIEELPGCAGQGTTPNEALADLREAAFAWVQAMIEAGADVPPPRDESEQFSGQFRLRVPVGLHRALAEEAEREGVSMNTLAASILAGGLGWRRGSRQSRCA